MRVEVIDREDIEREGADDARAALPCSWEKQRACACRPPRRRSARRTCESRARAAITHSSSPTACRCTACRGTRSAFCKAPPLDLGQVEIIKGAASALYGASALGGVVNLVARRPAEAERELLINATSQSGQDLTSWLANPIGRRSLVDPARRLSPPVGPGSGRRQLARPSPVRAHCHASSLLCGQRCRKDDVRDDRGSWPKIAMAAQRPGRNATQWAAIRGIVEDPPCRRRLRRTLACSRQSCAVRSRVLHAALAGSTVRNDSRARRAQHMVWRSLPARHQRATDMGWGRRISAGSGAGVRELPQFDYRFSSPSLFMQDEIAFTDKWTLAVSARADAHSEYGVLATPRISVLARPSAGWTVRVAAGTGAFAPTPFTEETEETGLSRVRPLSGLRAERAHGASLDVTRVFGSDRSDGDGVRIGRFVDPVVTRYLDDGYVEFLNAPETHANRGNRAAGAISPRGLRRARNARLDPVDGIRCQRKRPPPRAADAGECSFDERDVGRG